MSAMEEYATYVWTDPGKFGAWLTSEEQCALLEVILTPFRKGWGFQVTETSILTGLVVRTTTSRKDYP